VNFQIKSRIVVWAAGVLLAISLFSACKEDNLINKINIFSIDDDIKLGKQLDDQIAADPATYPLLPETQYAKSYEHIRRITTTLLNTGKIKYKDKFVWQIKIIQNDSTLNAFCAPGGYIYVYTGIIKYLEDESQLAGVMGHEIAHADRRHSTDQLTRKYGVDFLLGLLLGNNQNAIASIATSLGTLAYSRSNESEADLASVEYLCTTDYYGAGTAGFFKKLIADGQGGKTPAFLSTHPNPDNRVKSIEDEAKRLNCGGNQLYQSRYAELKSSLP